MVWLKMNQISIKKNVFACPVRKLFLHDDIQIHAYFQDLSPSCPKFIATQSPLPVTLIDFWCMVYEQGVEVLVTLSSEIEVGKVSPH